MDVEAVGEWVREAVQRREAALDPSRARARRDGIVHTPFDIALYLVRRADAALRERLGVEHGLADGRVALIDPACGPGVFLAAVRAFAGDRPSVPRVVLGLDVDPSALAEAGSLMRRIDLASAHPWHVELREGDTLALDPSALVPEGAIPVLLGNPPWSAGDASCRAAMDPHLSPYRSIDGSPLRERRVGVLADAYVRFTRWCERAVEGAGRGVLALALNSSFLDGPVHRGMRAHLSRTFDRIEVVDLGGNPRTRSAGAPRDESPFGVTVGSTLLVGTRAPRRAPGADCGSDKGPFVLSLSKHEVAPFDFAQGERLVSAVSSCVLVTARLWGSREDKAAALATGRFDFRTSTADPPGSSWVRRGAIEPSDLERYRRWPSIAELLPFHREGLQTNRDALCIAPSRDELLRRLLAFARGEPVLSERALAARHFDVNEARAAADDIAARARALELVFEIRPILYRPFDTRWAVLHPSLCHRPRPDLLAKLDGRRLAVLTCRKDRTGAPWAHALVTRLPFESSVLSTRSSSRARGFVGEDPDLVAWIYAVLWSRSYRGCFASPLAEDYPRIPPPPARIPRAAHALVQLHLAVPPVPPPTSAARPPAAGTIVVGHHVLVLDERLAGPLATTADVVAEIDLEVAQRCGIEREDLGASRTSAHKSRLLPGPRR